jgi:hypothetical protein
MRAALRSRLEKLEVVAELKKPQLIRCGYLKTLPTDYVGERHVVIVKREPAGASGKGEWCEFEERPGPAPVGAQEDDGITIYIIYRECEICQPGREEREQIDASATELAVEGSGKVAAG